MNTGRRISFPLDALRRAPKIARDQGGIGPQLSEVDGHDARSCAMRERWGTASASDSGPRGHGVELDGRTPPAAADAAGGEPHPRPETSATARRRYSSPDIAAGDRGFSSAKNEEAAMQGGVRRVVLPRPGRKRRPGVRMSGSNRGQRGRVGCERRISVIKRRHGLRRCRYRRHRSLGRARGHCQELDQHGDVVTARAAR